MELKALCVCLSIIGLVKARSCVTHSDLDLEGLRSKWYLLWIVMVHSKIECVLRCYEDQRCSSSQYSTATNQCQGHYKELKTDHCISAPSFKTFPMCARGKSVGARCLTNQDCTAKRTTCNNHRCRCVPGYLYSPRSHACVAECEIYANTFQLLPDQANEGYDDEIMTYVSPTECLDACRQMTKFFCRSIDFNKSTKDCYLSKTAQMMVPLADRKYSSKFYSYQRECAP